MLHHPGSGRDRRVVPVVYVVPLVVAVEGQPRVMRTEGGLAVVCPRHDGRPAQALHGRPQQMTTVNININEVIPQRI